MSAVSPSSIIFHFLSYWRIPGCLRIRTSWLMLSDVVDVDIERPSLLGA